jgi:hypothetical protein
MGGDIVPVTEIQISDADFSSRLKDMRIWLDSNHFAPSTFTYLFLRPGMKVRISFDNDDEATALAERFGGIVLDAVDAPMPRADAA